MDGLWVFIYPWVAGPLVAALLLFLVGGRSGASRWFAAGTLAVGIANYAVSVISWNEACWDEGQPCRGEPIEVMLAVAVLGAILTGLACLAWSIAILLRRRGTPSAIEPPS